MKKLFLLLLVIPMAIVTIKVYDHQKAKSLSDIMLTNIEALANNDEVSGNTVDCYSSSESEVGASYYDCGSCSRQTNAKGTGSSRTCNAG